MRESKIVRSERERVKKNREDVVEEVEKDEES
jgi:hypothetical protein